MGSFNGSAWTGGAVIPSASSYGISLPAMASYDGALYVAWEPGGFPSSIDYSVHS